MNDKIPPVSPDGPTMRSSEVACGPELARCGSCGRANGPGRLKCLYCGADLERSAGDGTVKLHLRKPEDWENGRNIVVLKVRRELSPDSLKNIADLLGSESDDIRKILTAERPLPIGRVELDREARAIAERLLETGIETRIITDEVLAADRPPVRLRGMEFGPSEVILRHFGGANVDVLAYDQMVLIVFGTIVEARSEVVEKLERKDKKVVSETQAVSDEPVLDIYSKFSPVGWRVRAGFDFSCLGDEKGLLVTGNFQKMMKRLESLASNAEPDRRYDSIRHLLGTVWALEARKEPFETRRAGFGRRERTSVGLTSNMAQFTKYSRLRWHLL